MVPPSAASKRPMRSATAPVNAPLVWPNISLSKSEPGMPPRFTFMNGFDARGLFLCRASASSSLPVPLSPVISTGAPVGATRAAMASTSRRALLSPIIFLRSKGLGVSDGVDPLLSLRLRAVAIRSSRRLLSHGFVMKSKAPFLIPSTARSMLPHAVISITGVSGRKSFTCLSSVRPSEPEVPRV